MRQAFPRVLVPDLPHDPALYRSVIELLPELQTLVVTAEDRGRREQYQAIRERTIAKSESKSLASYLESLAIEVEILAADDGQLPRLLQLFQRTNQFNLTTRRLELGELAACARDPRCRLLALKARDRFGDHGLVAAALVRKKRDQWLIDSFLMSCRVIGYGIETAFLSAIATEALGEVSALVGEFVPTKKNAPARDFYPRHGFARMEAEVADGGAEHWRLELAPGGIPWPSWIAREAGAGGSSR
jgi:FkbH-like protein